MGTNEVEVSEKISGISAAVKVVGGQHQLASRLKIRQQTVSHWVCRGYVPERHVAQISYMTGIAPSKLMKPTTVKLARDLA